MNYDLIYLFAITKGSLIVFFSETDSKSVKNSKKIEIEKIDSNIISNL